MTRRIWSVAVAGALLALTACGGETLDDWLARCLDRKGCGVIE